jgi:hypothetical protein
VTGLLCKREKVRTGLCGNVRNVGVPLAQIYRATFWTSEQIRFGRVVIPNLTLPGNPGSTNLILVTEIEICLSGRIEEITTDNYSREGTSSLGSSAWRLSP